MSRAIFHTLSMRRCPSYATVSSSLVSTTLSSLVVGSSTAVITLPSSRSSSTAAAVLESRDSEKEPPVVTMTRPRPRLDALREQLATDEKTPPRITTTKVKNSTKRKGLVIPESPNQLRQFLNQLQLPDDNAAVLKDSFGRQHHYLRISLTERCNLRCTYCMPEQGVPLQPSQNLLQTFEILHLAQHLAEKGVHKYRLTGGEPTLRSDLVDIVHGLANMKVHANNNNNNNTPSTIGMTTNGVTLYKYLPDLVQAGLTHVNISLDTLKSDKFAALTRRPATYLERVWQSLETAMEYHDQLSVKLNCVVMRGVNDDEVADFIGLTTSTFPALQVRFIEYMPFDDNGWNWDKCLPYKELIQQLQNKGGLLSSSLRALPPKDPHDTTKWYTTNGHNKIGFITSMSEHFCGGCNRLRITADGQIKVCLFDGQTEVSLRNILRLPDYQPTDLDKILHLALQHKHYKLGGHDDPADILRDAKQNRPMTLIGG